MSYSDVGSPNAILREQMDAVVILRTGRRIPRVRPVDGVHSPISATLEAVYDGFATADLAGPTRPDSRLCGNDVSVVGKRICEIPPYI